MDDKYRDVTDKYPAIDRFYRAKVADLEANAPFRTHHELSTWRRLKNLFGESTENEKDFLPE